MTPNDTGDTDAGSNNLQNFPVLTSASSGRTAIEGTLKSAPSITFRLEFFFNTSCDASGNGEGETFLGFTDITTDSGGNAGFTANLTANSPSGSFITATATDPGNNTSEFSKCLQTGSLPSGVCTPPIAGDLVVSESCTFEGTASAPANVIVEENMTLTIAENAALYIDFLNFHLLIKSGAKVVIKEGGNIH